MIKKYYCRRGSEFKIDDFNHIGTIAFLLKNLSAEEIKCMSEKILICCRLADNKDLKYIAWSIVEDFSEIRGDDALIKQLDEYMYSEKGKEDVKKITEYLYEEGFIRRDDYYRAFKVTSIVDKNMEPCIIKAENAKPNRCFNFIFDGFFEIFRDERYETSKPIGEKEMTKLFPVLKDILSVEQFELIKFYIEKADLFYYFTEFEADILLSAVSNVRKSKKTMEKIAKILD